MVSKGTVMMSKGTGLFSRAAFSNVMAKIGQVWQCEGEVMRSAYGNAKVKL